MEELESYNEKEEKGEKGDNEKRRVKFQLMGPLGQLYNIVAYICSSTRRIKTFLEIAGRMILLDNCTR